MNGDLMMRRTLGHWATSYLALHDRVLGWQERTHLCCVGAVQSPQPIPLRPLMHPSHPTPTGQPSATAPPPRPAPPATAGARRPPKDGCSAPPCPPRPTTPTAMPRPRHPTTSSITTRPPRRPRWHMGAPDAAGCCAPFKRAGRIWSRPKSTTGKFGSWPCPPWAPSSLTLACPWWTRSLWGSSGTLPWPPWGPARPCTT